MKSTIHRIKDFIDYKGISIRAFEISVGFSNGSFGSQLKNNKTIGVDKLEYILNVYPELNPLWILTGKGDMILSENNMVNEYEESNKKKNLKKDIQYVQEINTLLKENITLLKKEIEYLEYKLSIEKSMKS